MGPHRGRPGHVPDVPDLLRHAAGRSRGPVRRAGSHPRLIALVKESLGLDKPLLIQYLLFLKRIFLGDQYGWPGFGLSFVTRSPVRENFLSRAVVTFQLALGAAILWLIMGIRHQDRVGHPARTLVDRAVMGFALFGVSAPVFWLGLRRLYMFWGESSDGYQGLGLGGETRPASDRQPVVLDLLSPWIVLVAACSRPFYAADGPREPARDDRRGYIGTARAKGLSEGRRVINRHGLRASLTPVVTLFGVDFGDAAGRRHDHRDGLQPPGLGTVAAAVDSRATCRPSSTSPCSRPRRRRHEPRRRHRLRLPRPPGTVPVTEPTRTAAEAAARPEPLLEIKDLKVHFPTDDGSSRPWTACRSPSPGRDARRGGRVRLGQERDLPDRDGPGDEAGRDLAARSSSRARIC